MGGKTKQSQRTKNNVRPSSSGRSAELLGNMNTDFSLLKLNLGNGQSTLFPTLTTISLEQGLNPEFQMCIKKLNKKDPTTKTKALQELCELVNTNKLDDVVAVLPSWAHFYKILTVDTDRKVRESTQACHGALVSVCGRQVAPHLKQLLPAWLQALHDDHAPAQTLALTSLTKTFPERKLPEVLSFSKTEIMSHLLDSLVGNAESVLTRKMESAEEKEFQHHRLVTTSLRALEYLLPSLPGTHDDWLWSELTPLLQSNVFWKFSTYKDDQIRAAWFAATGRMIERFKTTFGEKYGTKTMRVLLGVAKETNAVVAANLWACLLQLMHSVQDWHKYLEKKELLVKRILDILENGGWGDARHLSNMLLPLLAHLPPDIFHKEFYQSFFSAIYAGLKQKNIWSSKSERQAWITSLGECLRYLSIQQYDFAAEVVTSEHRTWLQEVLCSPHDSQTKTNLVRCSASNMASLVKYWLKQSSEQKSEKYELLIRNFWQNIGATISTQIDGMPTSEEERAQLVQHHILLFKTLKTSFFHDPKKQQSIKFEVDFEAIEEKCFQPMQECDTIICERYKHNLDALVHLICLKYFEYVDSKRVCEPFMSSLVGLLTEFNEDKLFLCIAKHFSIDTLYKLYDTVLREWLSDEGMRCKALVDIVFLLLKHMSEEEQTSTMDSFEQFPREVAEWCACACAAPPHRSRAAVRRWARGEAVRDTLVGLCRRLVRSGSAADRSLLLACLARDETGEMVVGPGAVSGVVGVVCEALRALQPDSLGQCGALGALLVTALPQHVCSRDLLLQLFLLSYRVPRGDSRLSEGTWREVQDSWQDGIAALDRDQRLDFLLELAVIIRGLVLDNSDGLNTNHIEKLTSLCPYLLSKDSNPPEDLQLTSTFTRKVLDLEVESMEPFALHHDCIFSNLNCPFEDYKHLKSILDNQSRELSKPDVEKYLNSLLFRCMYQKAVLLHKADEDDDVLWCDPLLVDEQMLMEFCKVMHDYSIVCSLCEGYAFWHHYQVLQECKETLEALLRDIATESSPTSKGLILKKLSELAASNGYYWSYARRYFEILSKCDADEDESLDLTTLADAVTGNGFFHSLQAKTKNSSDEEEVHRTKFLLMLRSFYLAHAHQLEPVLVRELVAAERLCDPTVIINAYFRHNDIMLYETDITDAPWNQVLSNAAALDFLTHLVDYKGWDAPAHCWDFTTITLCSVVSSIQKSMHKWDSFKVGVLSRAVLRLYTSVSRFIGSVQEESMRRRPSAHVAHLPTEWEDIFAPDLNTNLFAIILHVLKSDASEMNCNRAALAHGLTRCAAGGHACWGAAGAGAGAAEGVARACAACMRGAVHLAYQYLAHATLGAITEPLVLEDAGKLAAWSERPDEQEERARPTLCIEHLHEAYEHLQAEALAALGEWGEEEGAECAGGREARARWCAWLLAADALHALCGRARDDLQQQLMRVYRARGYADPLLEAALRLLPARLWQHAQDNTSPPPAHYEPYFLKTPLNSVYESETELVRRLACRAVWWVVATGGGAAARGWLAAAAPRPARLLAYLVRSYVSPHLVRHQLTHLQRYADQLEDAEVTIRWSSNEVSCEFPVEERRIELRVWFARDHPLGLPRVAGPSPSGPAVNTSWIVLYLAYQNGMLLNALQMWMQAINSRIESSPQCYICYCRLDASSGRLPRARCFQCNNKFHHACLRKWFTTSKKSNCPLCRSPF